MKHLDYMYVPYKLEKINSYVFTTKQDSKYNLLWLVRKQLKS